MATNERRRSRQGPPRKPWSLLVYIAGDNNLSDYGLEDIQEMCEVGASSRSHVAVEIDTEGDFTGSIRYEIEEPDWSGYARRRVIERLPEQDSGDPETLRNFLRWGIGRCDAGQTPRGHLEPRRRLPHAGARHRLRRLRHLVGHGRHRVGIPSGRDPQG